MIEKISKDKNNYKRPGIFFNSAREGWAAVLEQYRSEVPSGTILLPAYIGWSSNEGSGIFDPVRKSGITYVFYKVNADFSINLADLQLKTKKDSLVLLVHYFGFTDSRYRETVDWLHREDIYFVEDCAHGLLSDRIGGVCGREGAYTFYSLHKLLPVSSGGLVVANKRDNLLDQTGEDFNIIWAYDLQGIYEVRRRNYQHLLTVLSGIEGITLLYPELPDGIGPQTLPVILKKDRDRVYHEMNQAGFGMVSLYHTMIREIGVEEFPASHFLAKNITNFPVHQDITLEEIDKMVQKFKEIYQV